MCVGHHYAQTNTNKISPPTNMYLKVQGDNTISSSLRLSRECYTRDIPQLAISWKNRFNLFQWCVIEIYWANNMFLCFMLSCRDLSIHLCVLLIFSTTIIIDIMSQVLVDRTLCCSLFFFFFFYRFTSSSNVPNSSTLIFFFLEPLYGSKEMHFCNDISTIFKEIMYRLHIYWLLINLTR
jgi:hypothetical protein